MRKIRNGLICFVVLLYLCSLSVVASEKKEIMQVMSLEQSVKIYVKGIENTISDISYQIADKPCSKVDIYSIDEDADAFRTLFLLDNSLSVKEEDKQTGKEIIKLLVENRTDNEQFRIATFGESVEYLTEYTDDYNSLLNCLDSIESLDRETYLTDVLYDLLNAYEMEGFNGYQRIIVISDGVDNKSIGITKDELYDLLKENQYPIYTIGAQNKKNDTELENMFAISRKTNAEYFLLDGQANFKQIVSQLNRDHSIMVFETQYPEISLDGSKQNSKLTFGDGEKIELKFEVQLPFGISEEKIIQTEEVTDETEIETESETIEETTETEEIVTEVSEKESGFSVRILLAGILVLAIIVCIIILLINRKKETKTRNKKQTVDDDLQKQLEYEEPQNDRTEIRSRDFYRDEDDKTEIVFDNWKQKHVEVEQASGIGLILNEKTGLQREFSYNLQNKVVIGRSIDKSQICISDDKSISSVHCEIGVRDGEFYIKDLNSGNGTYLNGNRIYLESEIVNGDQLRIGRTELIINFNV